MATLAQLPARRDRGAIGHNSARKASTYAIVVDLDTAALKQLYHNPSWQNAHVDVRNCLGRHGFANQQGSTYFGDDAVDAIRCVLAVQELTRTYDRFEPSVRDIRMLRIEDNNDLMPAIQSVGATRRER